MVASFTSASMIFSLIMLSHGYNYTGFHCLAVNYLAWGVGCIFSSKWTREWGFKKATVIGSLFNSVWIYGAILPLYKAEN